LNESSSRLKHLNYSIGFGIPDFTPQPCCVSLFQAVYQLSDRQIKNLRRDLRMGYSDSVLNLEGQHVIHDYNDTTVVNILEAKKIIKSRQAANKPLLEDDIGLLITPNNFISKLTFQWIDAYFKLVGDHMPNKANEIHLEPIEKKEIWCEYVSD
jgi:hypothetical protein